jgi:hypothetical protein
MRRLLVITFGPVLFALPAATEMPRGRIGPTRGRCLAKLRESLLADPGWSMS